MEQQEDNWTPPDEVWCISDGHMQYQVDKVTLDGIIARTQQPDVNINTFIAFTDVLGCPNAVRISAIISWWLQKKLFSHRQGLLDNIIVETVSDDDKDKPWLRG